MSELILFVMAAVGMTHIMVNSTIMAPLRRKMQELLPAHIYEVFECYQCMGTWCGFVCGALTMANHWLADLFLYGCASSIMASLAYIAMEYILCKTEYELPPEEES